MALNNLQKISVHMVVNFYLETITETPEEDKSLTVLQAILDYALFQNNKDLFAIDEVTEVRKLLDESNLPQKFNLSIYNTTVDATPTDKDVKDYIKELVNEKINSILKKKEEEIAEKLGHIQLAQDLFQLDSKITPKNFKLIKLLLSEPIYDRITDLTTLTEIKEKIFIFMDLIPQADIIDKLISMNEMQIDGAKRLITALKTGYSDEKVAELFLRFTSDNKHIENLTAKSTPQFDSILRHFGARRSPEWFTQEHPASRDLLVSLNDENFSQAVSALLAADLDGYLKTFIRSYPHEILDFGGMNPEQLNNVINALNEPKVRTLIHQHPNQIVILKEIDEHKLRKAAEILDYEGIESFIKRYPARFSDLVNFTRYQITQLSSVLAKNNPNNLLFQAIQDSNSFADMEPDRFKITLGLLRIIDSITYDATSVFNALEDSVIDEIQAILNEVIHLVIHEDDEELIYTLGNAIKRFPDCVGPVVREMPKDKIHLFVDIIADAIKENPEHVHTLTKTIAEDKLYLFKDVISNAVKVNPNLIKSIPKAKLYLFTDVIADNIKVNYTLADYIIKSIPTYQLYLFTDAFSDLIIKPKPILHDIAILQPLTSESRIGVVNKSLEKITDPSQMLQLIDLLPPEERKKMLFRATKEGIKIPDARQISKQRLDKPIKAEVELKKDEVLGLTLWQTLSDTAEIAFGNGSAPTHLERLLTGREEDTSRSISK